MHDLVSSLALMGLGLWLKLFGLWAGRAGRPQVWPASWVGVGLDELLMAILGLESKLFSEPHRTRKWPSLGAVLD